MQLRTLIQISHFDEKWEFNPEWVLGSNSNHFRELLEELNKLEGNSISIVTGDSEADDGVESLSEELGDEVIRQSKEKYEQRGLKEAARNYSENLFLIVSGYRASIDTNGLRNLIDEISDSTKSIVTLSTAQRRNYPCLVKREYFLEHSPDWPGITKPYKPPYHPVLWLTNNVPLWIFPAYLTQILYGASPDKAFNPRPEFLIHEVYSQIDELQFHPIVSSRKHGKYWYELKNDHNSDYLHLRKQYIESPPFPAGIQVDVPGSLPLFPHTRPNYLSSDLNGSRDLLDEGFSHLYQTYLQFGIYVDPLSFGDIENLLSLFQSHQFRIGISSRLTDFEHIHESTLLDSVHEIYAHIGALRENSYGKLYEETLLNQSLNNTKKIISLKKERALEHIQNFGEEWKFPYVIPTFFVTDQFLNQIEMETVGQEFDLWNEHRAGVSGYDPSLYTTFYNRNNPCEFFLLKELKSPFGVPSVSTPDHTPLNRFPCRRLSQSLTVLPGGDVYPCDQLIRDDSFLLGNLENKNIIDLWNSSKRIELLKEQRKGNFDKFEPCEKWYEPVV